MKKISLISLFMILLLTVFQGAAASEITVVLSSRIQPYEDAFKGVRDGLSEAASSTGSKTITPNSVTELYLTDPDIQNNLDHLLADNRQDLIVAIGSNALNCVRSIRDRPVIYLLVPDPPPEIPEARNITGVDMNVPAGMQIKALTDAVPAVKRIGVIYGSGRIKGLVEEGQRYAWSNGLVIHACEVRKSRDFNAALNGLKGRIDAFWMVPDRSVYIPENIELLFLFSLENQIPVLAFSEKYIKAGAVVSASASPYGMGLIAGRTAGRMPSGPAPCNVKSVTTDMVQVKVNYMAAEKLMAGTVSLPDKGVR